MDQDSNPPPNDTNAELRALRAEIKRVNEHRFVKIHQSPLRLILFQFTRGLAFGLGSVVGATILVSVLVYLLSQVEIIPILGDLATAIIEQIEAGRQTRGQ